MSRVLDEMPLLHFWDRESAPSDGPLNAHLPMVTSPTGGELQKRGDGKKPTGIDAGRQWGIVDFHAAIQWQGCLYR